VKRKECIKIESMEMIKILNIVELNINSLVKTSKLNTMYIDYHKPYVKRIWFQFVDYRVYLHKIEPCNEPLEALYHPHPWKSIIRILNEYPKTVCKLVLPAGTVYEMTDPNGWHYVSPVHEPVYSLMITGERYGREMPLMPNKEFRELEESEILDILREVKFYYSKIY
jgi:hypothetical protein